MSSTDALYYEVADIIGRVLAKELSVRTAVYGSYYKNKKVLLRLTCETLKFYPVFEEILKDKSLKDVLKDPQINGDRNLAYVLLYEYLVGSGLNRATPKLKAAIMKKGKEIKDQEKILAEEGRGINSIKEKEKTAIATKIEIPRYARINLCKWTKEEALKTLEEEEWKISEIDDVSTYTDRVKKMGKDEVLIDPHVDDLLIFPNLPNFHTYWMVNDRYIILQDKASCLPAFLLNPKRGSHVFDTCSAPGMKTSHIAALIGPKGKVFATDRSADRVQIMKDLLQASGVENADVWQDDFLKINVKDKKYNKVKYAVIDPPCSGSGMVKRLDELTGGTRDTERLEKLKNVQVMILKHALKFPKLQKAIYSTCSVHEEENEQVVDEALLDTYVRQNFRLQKDVLPSWEYRGLPSYEFVGPYCLRADPAKTLTNGFFVAVFERIPDDEREEE